MISSEQGLVKWLVVQLQQEQRKYVEVANQLKELKAKMAQAKQDFVSPKRESEMKNEISHLQQQVTTFENENAKLKSDLKALEDENYEMKVDTLQKQNVGLQILHKEVEKILDIQAAQYHLCNLSISMSKIGEDCNIQQEVQYFLLQMETAIQKLEQKANDKMKLLNINHPDDPAISESSKESSPDYQTKESSRESLNATASKNQETSKSKVATAADSNDGWFSKVHITIVGYKIPL